MTSITSSLSDYSADFTPTNIKNKLYSLSAHFLTLRSYPNEPLPLSILRSAFEAIAGIFIIFSMLLGGMPLSIGLMTYQALQPSDHCILGNASGILKREEINSHLHMLAEGGRRFKCIEIRNATPISVNEDTSKHLKVLCPTELVLPIVNYTNFIKSLESFTHYYKRKIDTSFRAKSVVHFERKEKIKHIVLPSDPHKMLAVLNKLVDREERVFKIYYTSLIPSKFQKQVQDLVSRLKPSVEALIDNKDKLSMQTLETMLYA